MAVRPGNQPQGGEKPGNGGSKDSRGEAHGGAGKEHKAKRLTPRLSPAEKGSRLVFLVCAVLAMGQMLLIMIFLFKEAAGLFIDRPDSEGLSIFTFLFSQD